MAAYSRAAGEKNRCEDVKAIAGLASGGERVAGRVFEEFGSELGNVLRPYVRQFEARCLVLGGQISRSFPLFSEQVKGRFQDIPHLKKVAQAELIELAPLYGVASKFIQDE